MAETKPGKKGTQQSVKKATGKPSKGFTHPIRTVPHWQWPTTSTEPT